MAKAALAKDSAKMLKLLFSFTLFTIFFKVLTSKAYIWSANKNSQEKLRQNNSNKKWVLKLLLLPQKTILAVEN